MLKYPSAANPTFFPMITKYFRKSFCGSLFLFWLRMFSHVGCLFCSWCLILFMPTIRGGSFCRRMIYVSENSSSAAIESLRSARIAILSDSERCGPGVGKAEAVASHQR